MRKAVLCLLALAVALPVVAQEQGAAIEGTIRDTQGGATPGAVVTVRNEKGFSVSTVTDGDGGYRFPSLPPGLYDVTATLTGFNPGALSNVQVALGNRVTVNLSLSLAGVTEELTVTGEAPIVDVKESARFTNIRAEFVDKLPKGRDFTTLATQAAGANYERTLGGLTIDGSSAAENKYVIDGVETNDLGNGVSSKDLVTDFVEEVQVKSSGYAAEYSGALGGVVNVITKSGTNAFKGSVWGYFSGDALGYTRGGDTGVRGGELGALDRYAPRYADGRSSLRRNLFDSTKAEYVTYDKDSVTQIEPGFSLGGPLVQDRAWFFLAYNPSFRTIDRSVDLATGGGSVSATEKRTTHFMTANLSTQLSDATRFRLAYNNSHTRIDGLLPALDGSDPAGSTYDVNQIFPNWSLSGNLDYVASSNFFVGLRGGYFSNDHFEEGRPQGNRYYFQTSNFGLAGVPDDLLGVTGFTDPAVDNFEYRKDQFTRLGLQADASWFVDAGGQHQIKFGVQFDRLGNNADSGETGHRVRLYWDRSLGGQRGTYGYYTVRSYGPDDPKRGFTTRGDVASNNWGLFLQDSWTIRNRLTLNLGLRTEQENIPNFGKSAEFPQEHSIEFGFADKIAPRAGFSYDVKGDGRWKVYGSWGIFYDIVKLEMPRGSFGGDHWLEYYYTLNTPNWPSLANEAACPPACAGTLIRGPIDFRHPSFDYLEPDLKPYKLEEFTAGIEHVLSSKMSVSLRYTHKQVDVAIEDVGSLDAQGNEIYVIGNPGFGLANIAYRFADGTTIPFPKAVRDYDGVEAGFNKRMSDNWSLRLNYLWSRLWGNYTGLSQGDEAGRISPNVGRNFDYPIMSFDETGTAVFGDLPTDRTHQFKAQLVYDFPFGTSVGLNTYIASGTPVSRTAAFLSPNNFPTQYLGRGSDGRTPTFSTVDLYVQHEIKLGGEKTLQLNANILNLFNRRVATALWETELEPGAGITVSEEQFYRGIDTASLIAAQGLLRDPRFLQPAAYQAPFEMRLGVRLIF